MSLFASSTLLTLLERESPSYLHSSAYFVVSIATADDGVVLLSAIPTGDGVLLPSARAALPAGVFVSHIAVSAGSTVSDLSILASHARFSDILTFERVRVLGGQCV